MYGADTEVATLLETVFHDVGFGGVIFERSLVDRGLVMLSSLVDLPLLDLRDDRLPALGLTRGQLVTTPAEHHACTREWVRLFREVSLAGVTPAGLLWHSRQADLAGGQPADVFMLFGDRAPSTRGAYRVHHPGVTNLVSGAGRVHIEQITEWLDVVIEPVS